MVEVVEAVAQKVRFKPGNPVNEKVINDSAEFIACKLR